MNPCYFSYLVLDFSIVHPRAIVQRNEFVGRFSACLRTSYLLPRFLSIGISCVCPVIMLLMA